MGAPSSERFTVRRRLGEGGMGVVYEAFDEERRASVALKTLNRFDGAALARFKREFRALQGLAHPNLVALDELFFESGQWFFTMELLDGLDFVSHVRGGPARFAFESTMRGDGPGATPARSGEADTSPSFDEVKLRESLKQLVEGLAALHGAEKVHRDVKPSNVMVTREGRVVLLDFGLVAEASEEHRSTGSAVVGTPTYMAPEQAASHEPTPAADLYAVGVMIYECLTGKVPLEGPPLQLLLDKQVREPQRPSALVPGVPRDLEDLCVALLRIDPRARPTSDAVLRALGGASVQTSNRTHSQTEQPPFVGRSTELETLRRALDDVRADRPVSVIVRGESGVGKSCLVRRFIETSTLEIPETLVLSGRCYEREAVPYKAFDGVVDSLTRFLLSLPVAEADRYLPSKPGLLAAVFPVLCRVQGFERPVHPAAMDPQELRFRAFAALREMLTRLAARGPLVVLVDDLQWADVDSLALLTDVTRPPEAPSMLLLATVRTASGQAPALSGDVRMIDLSRLSGEEGRNLATQLLARWAPDNRDAAAAIAQGAEGHPLFIDAIVHHLAAATDKTVRSMRLDEALWARVVALEEPARRVMEILAVAGAPLRHEVLVSAAAAGQTEHLRKLVTMLRVAHLVSTTGGRATDAIEPYHDRIRSAVLAHLDDDAKRAHHRALALAHERAASPDDEAAAIHWSGAGDASRAAKYAEAAGDGAARALAFDRAARLFQMAIDLADPSGDAGRALHEKLGDALANAGRGTPAASAYARASEGAPAAHALELKRRAADQLVRSGQFDRGLSLIRVLLASVHVGMPETPLAAIVTFVFWRIFLRLRGLRFKERDPSQVAPQELTRIDLCWLLSFGIGMVDNIRGSAFQPRTLLVALRAGEPKRIALALATEVAYTSRAGTRSWPRTQALIAELGALSSRLHHPLVSGWNHLATGTASYLAGEFAPAIRQFDQGLSVFREQCVGVAWEIDTTELFVLNALTYNGQISEVSRRRSTYLREAVDRGDLYAAVHFRTSYGCITWLAEDEPDACLRDVADAMARWSKQGFHLEHYYAMQAEIQAVLYAGRWAEAHERVLAAWAPMRRSLLWTLQFADIATRNLRARTAIALAESRPSTKAALLRGAERDVRAMEKQRTRWGNALATLTRAGIANADGASARAEPLLRLAIAGLDQASMQLHAAAARRMLGSVVGGDEGATLVREADASMTREGVRKPAKMAAMLAPGFARASPADSG